HRAVRAEIAHDGHARAQRRARVLERLERGERVGLTRLSAEVGGAVERQVRMAIDHPRDHEGRRGLERAGARAFWRLGWARTFAHPGDLTVVETIAASLSVVAPSKSRSTSRTVR